MLMQKTVPVIALMSSFFLSLGQPHMSGKATGELAGRVVDDGDDTPILGASIQAAQVDGNVTAKTLTERDGTYKILGLPVHAKFRVTYAKENYVSDLHEIIVTANQDGRLLKLRGDQSYYEKKAEKIKVLMSQTSGQKQEQVWDEEWGAIEKAPILPQAKGWIARALQSSAPQSRKSGLFIAYATADLKVLEKLNVMLLDPERSHEPVLNSPADSLIRANIKSSLGVRF